MSSELGKPCICGHDASFEDITIRWKAPEYGKVKEYKILYRSTDEKEFTEHTTYGSMLSRYIKGLCHGVKYEFKVRAVSESKKTTTESDGYIIETKEYYDIVMVGKTGLGKSTLGNKLLSFPEDTPDTAKVKLFESEPSPDSDSEQKKHFTQADDLKDTKEAMASVTVECKLLANETSGIRVLDVPGFSDSGKIKKAAGKAGENLSVQEINLQIVRYVVRAQLDYKLKVRRIVYFIPQRGSPEKADGTLQEELSVLYYYFGKGVFKCMVVLATNSPRPKHQKLGFEDEEIEQSKMVINTALKSAIPNEDVDDLPIEYIGLSDSPKECLKKIKDAISVRGEPFTLQFQENTCARCTVKFYNNEGNQVVEGPNGKLIKYTESKCHPCFVQKYSMLEKIAGGVGHIVTLGAGLLYDIVSDGDSWPGFTNSDEVCIECRKSPGSLGCTLVTTTKVYENFKIKVEHVNKL